MDEPSKIVRDNRKHAIAFMVALVAMVAFVLIMTSEMGIEPGITAKVTYGPGGCVVPEEDLLITESVTLCSGVYYLDDITNNGSILIGARDISVSCDDTVLIGTSKGIMFASSFSGNDNVEIARCSISNVSLGIHAVSVDGWIIRNNFVYEVDTAIRLDNYAEDVTIYDNVLENSSSNAIWAQSTSNSNISKNTIRNAYRGIYTGNGFSSKNNIYAENQIFGSAVSGILFDGGDSARILNNVLINEDNFDRNDNTLIGIGTTGLQSTSFIIESNVLNGFGLGITTDFSKDNIIRKNNISNSGVYGINTRSNNTLIEQNIVINSSWNSIHFDGYNQTIINNYLENYIHHGIDSHNIGNYTISGNSIIANNSITQSSSVFYEGDAAIFLSASGNNKVHSNKIFDIIDDDTPPDDSRGIKVESGDLSINNLVYNNTIENISGVCIYDNSANTTYENNTFSGCESIYSINIFGAWDLPGNISRPKFVNNTDLSKELYFLMSMNERVELKILQNSTYKIRTAGGGGRAYLYLYSPYNDVKNLSNNDYISNNTEFVSLSLKTNQNIQIGDYVPDPEPEPTPNIPPNLSKPVIESPSQINLVNQNLTCVSTITDADADLLNVTVTWFNNNINFLETDFNNNFVSGTQFESILDSTNTNIGDNWICQIKVTDGNFTTTDNSTPFSIQITTGITYNNFVLNQSSALTNDTVKWSLVAESEYPLDSYTFQYYNGTFTNNTNALTNYPEESRKLSEGINCGKFYLNNSNGDLNQTNELCIQAINKPEQRLEYSNFNNDANNPEVDQSITWSIDVNSSLGLKSYLFTTNTTGNYEYENTLTNNETNLTIQKVITLINEGNTCARFIFTDSEDNTNGTTYNCINVSPKAIVEVPIEVPQQTTSSGGGSSSGTLPPKEEVEIEIQSPSKETQSPTTNVVSQVKQSSIPPPKTTIYKYLETNESLKDFKVEKMWLEANNIHSSNVKLFAYNNTWQELDIEIIREDENYIYFKTNTNNNLLVIGADKTIEEQPIQTQKPELIKEAKTTLSSFLWIGALLLILLGIIYEKLAQKPINNFNQEKVISFVDQAMNAGYSFRAVYHVLRRKGYHENLILYAHKHRKLKHPNIRFKKAIKEDLDEKALREDVNLLVTYINNQTQEGFKLHDIKLALLHYGHPIRAVDLAMKIVKSQK